MADDVESVIEIAAPRERVWRALTDPSLVQRWMGCLRFRAEAGHVFYLQPDRARRAADDVTGAVACRIEVLDAPRRLTFSWGFPDTPETWVDIRLRRIPGGAHVRLVHTGWDRFEDFGDFGADEVRGGMGWAWHAFALPALRAVAEDGT